MDDKADYSRHSNLRKDDQVGLMDIMSCFDEMKPSLSSSSVNAFVDRSVALRGGGGGEKGFRIWNEHSSVLSTVIMAPALSNSPQYCGAENKHLCEKVEEEYLYECSACFWDASLHNESETLRGYIQVFLYHGLTRRVFRLRCRANRSPRIGAGMKTLWEVDELSPLKWESAVNLLSVCPVKMKTDSCVTVAPVLNAVLMGAVTEKRESFELWTVGSTNIACEVFCELVTCSVIDEKPTNVFVEAPDVDEIVSEFFLNVPTVVTLVGILPCSSIVGFIAVLTVVVNAVVACFDSFLSSDILLGTESNENLPTLPTNVNLLALLPEAFVKIDLGLGCSQHVHLIRLTSFLVIQTSHSHLDVVSWAGSNFKPESTGAEALKLEIATLINTCISIERALEKRRKMSANIQTEQDLTEAEKFHRIIHDIYTNPRPHEDKKDNSNHPSYRKFKLPYHVQCAIRYENAKRAYEDQFQREINKLIALQSSGYEAARMNSSSDSILTNRQIYGLPLSLRLRSGAARRKPALKWANSTSSQRKNLLEGSIASSYSAADSEIDWNAKKGPVSEDYKNLHLSFRNFDSNDNSIDSSYTNALAYYARGHESNPPVVIEKAILPRGTNIGFKGSKTLRALNDSSFFEILDKSMPLDPNNCCACTSCDSICVTLACNSLVACST
uniref:Uncharacterized protein n=1 Tax=Glossina pallidipes TaxID=7398 RepID=A0A1A9ZUI0_GLOPL